MNVVVVVAARLGAKLIRFKSSSQGLPLLPVSAPAAKFGANRSRSASSKATAATAVAMAGAAPLMTSGNEDAAAAGRKRKAGDEVGDRVRRDRKFRFED